MVPSQIRSVKLNGFPYLSYLKYGVETLEEPLHVSFPLRARVNVDKIC